MKKQAATRKHGVNKSKVKMNGFVNKAQSRRRMVFKAEDEEDEQEVYEENDIEEDAFLKCEFKEKYRMNVADILGKVNKKYNEATPKIEANTSKVQQDRRFIIDSGCRGSHVVRSSRVLESTTFIFGKGPVVPGISGHKLEVKSVGKLAEAKGMALVDPTAKSTYSV